jgi:hypothetical protein
MEKKHSIRMALIFPSSTCPWFSIPQAVVKQEMLSRISGSAAKLYLALCYEGQRKTKTELTMSQSQLATMTGLSSNSLKSAAEELIRVKLLDVARPRGGTYKYTLLVPERIPATERNLDEMPTVVPLQPNRKRTLFDLTLEEYGRYFDDRLHGMQRTGGVDEYMSNCPFHDDSTPSLSVKASRGQWYCHACNIGGGVLAFEQKLSATSKEEAMAVIAEITGVSELLESSDCREPEAIYSYVDEDGVLLWELLRFNDVSRRKYRQRKPSPDGDYVYRVRGVRRVLYRLPDVLNSTHVIVCEGEKDVESVRRRQLKTSNGDPVAVTTSPGGAGKWKRQFSDYLQGKSVIIFPDMDQPGLDHAEKVQRMTNRYARIVHLPQGYKDIHDYLEDHSKQQLVDLIGADWFQSINRMAETQVYVDG